MSLGKIIKSILLLLICLAPHFAFAGPKNSMPKGMTAVKFGMTEKELITVKPNAKLFDFDLGGPTQEDEDLFNKLYLEVISELPFFGNHEITYGFYKGKLGLINLQDVCTPENCHLRRQQIIKGAINKWGNYRLLVDYRQAGQPSLYGGTYTVTSRRPALIWKVEEIEILLSFNYECLQVLENPCKQYTIIIAMYNRKYCPPSAIKELNSYIPATEAEINAVKNELRTNTVPPYFE